MSDRVNQSMRRINSISLVYMLALGALMLGAYAAFLRPTPNESQPTREMVVGDEVTPESAQAILDRANDATAFADLLLSFIEGASVLVGAVVAVGAYILRRSILVEFKQAIATVDNLEERIKQREQTLQSRERQLDSLRDSLLARMESMMQDNQKAFEAIRQHAEDSFRVVSLQLLAEQQVRAHNILTAIQTLTSAHELEPENQATNYLLGYLYTIRKEFDKAIEHLETALSKDRDFAPAIAALGLALRRKGDAIRDESLVQERNRLWAQAEEKLLQALQADGSLTDADGESYYGTLGGLYRRQKRYEDALHAYNEARKVTPDSSYPIINLAALNTYLGNAEDAEMYFKMVLKNALLELDDDPRNMWTRMDYAQALLVLGEPDQALAELRTVLGQGPERGLLETVNSGLHFLSLAQQDIEGLDAMLEELERELSALPEDSNPSSEPAGAVPFGGTQSESAAQPDSA